MAKTTSGFETVIYGGILLAILFLMFGMRKNIEEGFYKAITVNGATYETCTCGSCNSTCPSGTWSSRGSGSKMDCYCLEK
jgi:hypothetical protein